MNCSVERSLQAPSSLGISLDAAAFQLWCGCGWSSGGTWLARGDVEAVPEPTPDSGAFPPPVGLSVSLGLCFAAAWLSWMAPIGSCQENTKSDLMVNFLSEFGPHHNPIKLLQ